jgi:hypothetical protein
MSKGIPTILDRFTGLLRWYPPRCNIPAPEQSLQVTRQHPLHRLQCCFLSQGVTWICRGLNAVTPALHKNGHTPFSRVHQHLYKPGATPCLTSHIACRLYPCTDVLYKQDWQGATMRTHLGVASVPGCWGIASGRVLRATGTERLHNTLDFGVAGNRTGSLRHPSLSVPNMKSLEVPPPCGSLGS